MKTIKCYSKFCVKNSYGKDWLIIDKWAKSKGFDDVEIYRTIYDLSWHKEAVEIFGAEDYPPFLVYRGKPKTVASIISEMKGKNDLHTATIKKSNKKTRRKTSSRKSKKKDEE